MPMKILALAFMGVALAGASFAAGRLSAFSSSGAVTPETRPVVTLTQNSSPAPQAPNDPREMIPLGPNGGQQPGQKPGQQPGQQPAQCPVQIYQDGKLYTFPQPGQQPGPGNGPQPGGPGQPQELIPINPGGGSPSLPANPGLTPNSPTNPKVRS